MECWLPDLRRVLPKLRLLRSNEDLFCVVAEALSARIAALVHRRGGGRGTRRGVGTLARIERLGPPLRCAGHFHRAVALGGESGPRRRFVPVRSREPRGCALDAVDVEEFIDIAWL